MDHVAIMKKSWGLTGKILSGEKKIESRWYLAKRSPWNLIRKGETVYFKNSGEPVSIKAGVSRITQIEGLNPKKIKELLLRYGKQDGIGKNEIPFFFKMFRDKKYCILVFLEKPQKIKPFFIDKSGFGSMASWISVANIKTIKKCSSSR